MICSQCKLESKGFFCDQDESILKIIDQNKMVKKFYKGEAIFHEGQRNLGLFCINKGAIKLCKKSSNGKESIIHIATVNELIGHQDLFASDYYRTSAIALEDTVICFLDKKFMASALINYPSIALSLIQKLGKEKNECESRFSSIIQRNVRERLADMLLYLAENFSEKENEKIRITIKLTREEMASMIGTANETVIRFLGEFKNEGIIESKSKTIFILDKEKLKQFAHRE